MPSKSLSELTKREKELRMLDTFVDSLGTSGRT